MKLSVVIPSYKDKYLNPTVQSLLDNSELPKDELEIICVMDGYWQAPIDDPRVKVLHLGKTGGMRNAINQGVKMSKGEYIMRTDEHCMFDKGYDVKLLKRFKENWIVYPVRYYLDPVKWERMDKAPNVYNRLIIDESKHKFSGVNWKGREKGREHKEIDESFAMQGSCWVMRRSWWDKVIKELQTEGYGPHYGDSHEMVFKTWKAGGKLMVNKTTWYAHKDRSFNRTHNLSSEEASPGWAYSISVWGDYFNQLKEEKKI